MRLSKTFLLLFLLINIVFVTFAPKYISDEGQTSGSKVNVEDKEEEDEEILDEGFQLDLHFCEKEILTVFKHKNAFDNFCEGLLNINEDKFYGRQTHSSTAHIYYNDLLHTLPKLNLLHLISPKTYCHAHYSKDAKKCIRLIQDAGCHVDADGIACIRHLYIHWKLRDGNTKSRPTPATRNLSDEMLMQLFLRGFENPSEFDDEVLLQEYYDKHGHPELSEEDIMNNYQIHVSETEYPYDFETFRNAVLQIDREHYLHLARLEKYGVPNLPYSELCREHLRRDYIKHITEFYDNHYANFLIDEIKKYDCSQFKSPKEYCKEHLKIRRQVLGSSRNIMY